MSLLLKTFIGFREDCRKRSFLTDKHQEIILLFFFTAKAEESLKEL